MLLGNRLGEAEGLYEHVLIFHPTGDAPGSQETPYLAHCLTGAVGAGPFVSFHRKMEPSAQKGHWMGGINPLTMMFAIF